MIVFMKSIKKLLLASFAMLFCNMIHADERPIADFGDYGIKYCKTVEEYQKNYLGKVVKYLPYEGTGSWHDLKYFLNKPIHLDLSPICPIDYQIACHLIH